MLPDPGSALPRDRERMAFERFEIAGRLHPTLRRYQNLESGELLITNDLYERIVDLCGWPRGRVVRMSVEKRGWSIYGPLVGGIALLSVSCSTYWDVDVINSCASPRIFAVVGDLPDEESGRDAPKHEVAAGSVATIEGSMPLLDDGHYTGGGALVVDTAGGQEVVPIPASESEPLRVVIPDRACN
jgi:hypothetical protein